MNKENIARIILENYMALAKEMDVNIQTDEVDLLPYLETLKQQVEREIERIHQNDNTLEVETTEDSNVESPVIPPHPTPEPMEPTSQEQEPKEESYDYSDEYITEMAEQLINTGSITTLTPLDEELMDKITAKVKEIESKRNAMANKQKNIFQVVADKLKSNKLVRAISFKDKNILTLISTRIQKNAQTEELNEVPTDSNEEHDYDQEYIDELANILINEGTIRTLTPLEEELRIRVSERATELMRNNQKNSDSQNSSSTPSITPPTPVSPSLDESEILEEYDQEYIEQMATMLVNEGQLITFAPISEDYRRLIEKRAQEIRLENSQKKTPEANSQSDELTEMFEPKEYDQELIDHLANLAISEGSFYTLSPLDEELMKKVNQRIAELTPSESSMRK